MLYMGVIFRREDAADHLEDFLRSAGVTLKERSTAMRGLLERSGAGKEGETSAAWAGFRAFSMHFHAFSCVSEPFLQGLSQDLRAASG